LPDCVLSLLRTTDRKLRLFSIRLPVHYLNREKQTENCDYFPFACLFTVFTENNRHKAAVILHLAVCALSSPRKTDRTLRLLSICLPVYCLYLEQQTENCGYSPCGCLCTVFAEKNRQETAVTLHLPVCALSSLRKTDRKLQLFSIWLSVHCLH